jgi:hypothetical protein
LIRLLQDNALEDAVDSVVVYGQVHAWRALAQMRAEAAIEPLLELLDEQENFEDWDNWITEEVPIALGMIGPAALGPVANRLEASFARKHVQSYFAHALQEIAAKHPETHDEVVHRLTAFLDNAADNDPSVNGFVVGYLTDLEAVEAWPVVERAYTAGLIDVSIVGGLEEVKWQFGLGPRPIRKMWPFHEAGIPVGFVSPDSARAEKRAKKQKAAKRKTKRSR